MEVTVPKQAEEALIEFVSMQPEGENRHRAKVRKGFELLEGESG